MEKDNPKVILVAIVALAQSVRLGLRAMLESDDQVQIVGEAATLNELSRLPRHTDVVVIAAWGNSLHLIQNAIAESLPETPVLLLSNGPVPIQTIGSLAERAWGFLSMDTTQAELTAAVHALSLGLWVGDSSLTGKSSQIGSAESDDGWEGEALTSRETEILQLLAQGLPNKQIALRIGISENTVKYHISSIYSKLGATNRTEAVRLGAQRGIIVL
ncbi:MAG: response regulator transcription factor [Anaerolineaceae bacterium]